MYLREGKKKLCGSWETQEKENMKHNSEDTRFSEEGRGGIPDTGADCFPAHGEDPCGVVFLSVAHGR